MKNPINIIKFKDDTGSYENNNIHYNGHNQIVSDKTINAKNDNDKFIQKTTTTSHIKDDTKTSFQDNLKPIQTKNGVI